MAKKVLIVDDSKIARKIMRRSLPTDWDSEIIEACNGAEAIKLLSMDSIEVVLLDLTMPEMDGYQVLDWIKNNNCSSLVIVVSADVQPKARIRALMMGAFDFIEKPASCEKIQEILTVAGVL